MINPCENCSQEYVEFILGTQRFIKHSQETVDIRLSALWDDVSSLKSDLNTLPSNTEAKDVAQFDQSQALVEDRIARIAALSQSLSFELTDGISRIEEIVCGDTPVSCPKAVALGSMMMQVTEGYLDDAGPNTTK